ncbi:MAG: hypothetical protein AAGE89_10250, partial [Pseudomonadota bacterium]
YVLWATPRSTSTAFEWMMRMRGDLFCFHEPFGEAWYQGPEARAPRPAPADKQKPDVTFESVWTRMLKAAENQPVFSKDMPHHTDHLWDDAFLDHINHSFLIRDPAKVLASLHRSYQKAGITDGFEPHEISFDAQHRLFHLLAERTGTTPVVIDSDDLLSDPPAMVRSYCEAIGIPFIEEALTWEPGARNEVLWYDDNDDVWHASLRDSDGLKAQTTKPVDPETLPDYLKRHYESFMELYGALHAHRLTVSMEPAI